MEEERPTAAQGPLEEPSNVVGMKRKWEPETTGERRLPVVSVIIPVHNAEQYLRECLESVLCQTYCGPIEVSMYEDLSQDNSFAILEEWVDVFERKDIRVRLSRNNPANSKGRGCGYAKNRAAEQSTGEYFCFLDSDDIMMPDRIELQLEAAVLNPNAIIGSGFVRVPEGSTERYTDWCNRLTQNELMSHRFREVTIIQPTWFMSRTTFDRVGGYDESYPKCPEDLIFFHAHLSRGGTLHKVDKYRYHQNSTCKGIHRLVLMKIRVEAFQQQILVKPEWDKFTIWGGGRDGKKFFNALSSANQKKVVAFCDIDPKKIGTKYRNTNLGKEDCVGVPIIHFSQAKPPIVTCVALDRTESEFERNVASLGLTEGEDLFYFS